MSAIVEEHHSGRQLTGRAGQRLYYIKNVSNETEALAGLLADSGVPTSIDGLNRIDAECAAEELEAGRFLGTAVYRSPDWQRSPNTFNVSFDISGQTTRVTQSKKTMGKFAPTGKTPKDFHGAINVQQDGTVEGTEIIVAYLTYAVNYTFNDSDITTTFVNNLALIVGTVNKASFHGYAAGELLLTKASGQKRTDGSNLWDVTFSFAVSRNKTGIIIAGVPDTDIFGDPVGTGGSITVDTKRGWEFLWVRYEEAATSTGVWKVPVSAYVEQVYDYTDYSLLGI